MNCETCQHDLLDLLYDEVPRARADELRAHVSGCASCKGAFEKLDVARRLARELPSVEPPASLDAVIMAAARAKASGRATAATAATAEDEGLFAVFLRFVSGIAMGPQVAMATIMMLVVAIGLWYFPSERDEPEAGHTVVSPEHGGEAGATATLEPAEPLDLALDPATGRLRERSLGGGPPATLSPIPAADEPAADPDREPNALARADDRGSGGEVVEGQLDQQQAQARNTERDLETARAEPPMEPAATRSALPFAEERQRQQQGRLALEDNAGSDGLVYAQRERPATSTGARSSAGSTPRTPARHMYGGAAAAGDSDEAPPVAPSIAPSTPPAVARQESTATESYDARRRLGSGAGAGAAGPTPTPAPAQAQAQPGSTAAPSGRDAYARGMDRYRHADYWAAAEEFNRVVQRPDATTQGLVPSALHHMARSHARANACNTAIPHYERLLSAQYATYPDAPRATMELAECYRRTGRLSDAERTLERAERFTSVAVAARRELVGLRTAMRASRRSIEAEAGAAAADEAAEAPAAAPPSRATTAQ